VHAQGPLWRLLLVLQRSFQLPLLLLHPQQLATGCGRCQLLGGLLHAAAVLELLHALPMLKLLLLWLLLLLCCQVLLGCKLLLQQLMIACCLLAASAALKHPSLLQVLQALQLLLLLLLLQG
jgi:hypothetical protein